MKQIAGPPRLPVAHMWIQIVGFVALGIAVLAFVWALRLSYRTHCGGIGQTPVLGVACIQVPALTIMGLLILGKGLPELLLPWWAYPPLWFVLVIVAGWATIKVGRLGEAHGDVRLQGLGRFRLLVD